MLTERGLGIYMSFRLAADLFDHTNMNLMRLIMQDVPDESAAV